MSSNHRYLVDTYFSILNNDILTLIDSYRKQDIMQIEEDIESCKQIFEQLLKNYFIFKNANNIIKVLNIYLHKYNTKIQIECINDKAILKLNPDSYISLKIMIEFITYLVNIISVKDENFNSF